VAKSVGFFLLLFAPPNVEELLFVSSLAVFAESPGEIVILSLDQDDDNDKWGPAARLARLIPFAY
jgi:hypothetical protein